MKKSAAIVRRETRKLLVGNVVVGGNAPISVQSMTKTKPTDIKATVKQIRELEELGCEIIRLAIPDMPGALALSKIKKQIRIPIEADIHFNPKLALESIRQGVDSIRLNPGNLTNIEAIKEIAEQCRKKHIPIRIGVNSGSVAGWFRSKLHREINPSAKIPEQPWQVMADAALEYCQLLEKFKFTDLMISLKASDVVSTILAYRYIAKLCIYPLHLGITASGTLSDATVKSSVGIGSLLMDGIGDTIRVSITGTPHDEVKIGYKILQSLNLRKTGIEVISCPTCGRCEIDLVKMAERIKSFTEKLPSGGRNLKVAVMGCVVNGPGEAEECDIGIAGGKGFGFLFKKGKRVRKITKTRIVPELINEIKSLYRND